MIEEQYPKESWIHVYTDGSATNAVKNGGAGVLVMYPDGGQHTSGVATGKTCSNYAAEVEALIHSAQIIENSQNDCPQVVFLTDAQSVLEAYQNRKLPDLENKLYEISKEKNIVLQWIPSHCGIPGNETADQLAKQGAKQEQSDRDATFEETKTLIKSIGKQKERKDDIHTLPRKTQVIIFRLRTGHNRLNQHMHRKFKLVPSPLCECGEEEQSTEHVLQRCKLLENIRKETWTVDTSLSTKLYGTREDLNKTTEFIVHAGLVV